MKTVLLSTAYFPPVSFVSSCMLADSIQLEAHEHYVKQTYRNRASICGANGKLDLIIPVEHNDLYTKPICEIRMASGQNWKKIHWHSIASAYRNSPFYEYYEQELKAVFDQPEDFLFHWNSILLHTVFELLEIDFSPTFTANYIGHYPEEVVDLRHFFHPKEKKQINFPLYSQVFMSKNGFIRDLSVLDLLFNLGRESKKYLRLLSHTC